jgi:adenylate cyclase
MSDLFALQNEVTSRIAVALDFELVGAEATRQTEHPDALDYILRGRAARARPPSRDNRTEAIGEFERALALDPRSVEAQSWLAITLMGLVMDNMSDSPAADLARAEALAAQALAASPRNLLAHSVKGQMLRAQNRFDEAIAEYEKLLALNRNYVHAYSHLAQCKIYTGSIDQVAQLAEQAIRLSPRDHLIGIFYQRIGLAHLLQSHIDEAIIWLERACNHNPAYAPFHAQLASAYGLNGETQRAIAELAEARRLSSDDRFSSIARLRAIGYWGVPSIRALFESTYLRGLRLAGMPEE